MTVIDNDYHPIDQGLEATNDHWGTLNAPMGEKAASYLATDGHNKGESYFPVKAPILDKPRKLK